MLKLQLCAIQLYHNLHIVFFRHETRYVEMGHFLQRKVKQSWI